MPDVGELLERKRRFKAILGSLEATIRECPLGIDLDSERGTWEHNANHIRGLLQATQEAIEEAEPNAAWQAIANTVGRS